MKVQFAALLLLLSAAPLGAQPGVRADAAADRKSATLSQPVRVTLTLEGPAPLLVKLPEQMLTSEADSGWRIRPDPLAPRAEVRPAANGREEWRQVFKLDAFPPLKGEQPLISFNPVSVNGQPVTWPPVAVAVTNTVGADDKARPVTPPEDLPVPVDPPPRAPVPLWVVFAFGPVCVAVALLLWARKRRPKPVPPGEWALAALANVEPTGAEAVERVAAVVRTFVERRYAIPATKLTTSELSAAAREQGWPADRAEPLGAILDACDRAKFAGDVPADGGRQLVRLAAEWVTASAA